MKNLKAGEVSCRDVRALMRLMVAHRIDTLKVSPEGAIEMTKSLHFAPTEEETEDKPEPGEEQTDADEDVMFYSSGAPRLSLREIESRSANKPEPPKVQ